MCVLRYAPRDLCNGTSHFWKCACTKPLWSNCARSIDKLSFIKGVMEPRIYWKLTMLIILGGLPGTGKTTIARELSRQLGAVHVRIDSIEEAIVDSEVLSSPINDAGDRVG